ncbi:hypothetical protein ACIBG8_46830 [Nonomuraea sp. NPDC050556]|uniref:hypothetical protein n=1 Tax=Nonomuraea sp. NPDC050556 TaxID=3364369 RepID=UPI0037A66A22
MQVRIIGEPDQVAAAIEAISAVLTVSEVSRPYGSRRNPTQVRVYMEVTAPAAVIKAHGSTTESNPGVS